MSGHYQDPNSQRRRHKTINALDKVKDLHMRHDKSSEPEADDPLDLSKAEFVLSRVSQSNQPRKKNKNKRKQKKAHEIAAATVDSVTETGENVYDIALHMCSIKGGEPIDFSHKLTVSTSNYANLDDYHSYVRTGNIHVSGLRREFQFLINAVGKEAFRRAQRVLRSRQE